MKNKIDELTRCHFCGRTNKDGIELVRSDTGANICTDCIQNISDMIERNNTTKKVSDIKPIGRIPTPSEIVEKLDEYVIGQADAKRTLAVAVYNHYCRLAAKDGYDAEGKPLPKESLGELGDVEIEKSNILMMGPTGCGKTMLAKTVARILDVPFAIADATTLTEAGYVGEDVENVVRYLYNNADRDVNKTARGIIWIDEIDKIASKTQNVSLTRDVSGEGVQQALLKIIEGSVCRFPPKGGRKHPDQELVEIDTSDILFICGGAFVGLDKIVEQRVGEGFHQIGFVSKEDAEKEEMTKKESNVRPEDLVKFGLIPEFVGRLPVMTEMEELSEEELVRVLTEPKNALTKQYKKLLRLSNVRIEFDEASLRKMAKNAIDRKTGARGLKAEMENWMKDIMFKMPDKRMLSSEVIVSIDSIEKAA